MNKPAAAITMAIKADVEIGRDDGEEEEEVGVERGVTCTWVDTADGCCWKSCN